MGSKQKPISPSHLDQKCIFCSFSLFFPWSLESFFLLPFDVLGFPWFLIFHFFLLLILLLILLRQRHKTVCKSVAQRPCRDPLCPEPSLVSKMTTTTVRYDTRRDETKHEAENGLSICLSEAVRVNHTHASSSCEPQKATDVHFVASIGAQPRPTRRQSAINPRIHQGRGAATAHPFLLLSFTFYSQQRQTHIHQTPLPTTSSLTPILILFDLYNNIFSCSQFIACLPFFFQTSFVLFFLQHSTTYTSTRC